MNGSWLQRQAQLHPERPAFYWQDKSWSFAALQQEVTDFACYYQEKIPQTVKRVAILSNNSPEMYFTILALWELGKEVQLLNTRLTAKEIQYQLDDGQCLWVITNLPVDLPMKQQLAFGQRAGGTVAKPAESYQKEQIASIMYTSGTTGNPKGVPQTFGNHLASAQATQLNLAVTPEDCWSCVVPLYHISGLSILLRSLVLGISVRLYDRFDAVQMADELLAKKVTIVSFVSKMLSDLLPLIPDTGYPSLRYVLLGGGPIAKEVLAQCQAKQLAVIQSYGMTETCSQVVALPPDKAAEKIGSSGLPLSQVELRIQPQSEQSQKEQADVIGEIQLRGPAIVTHYLNNRGSDQWSEDGWFATGDLGFVDSEGYLYVVTRLSELIISGGENIYPTEVEQALVNHPKIAEAAVVGETSQEWGQVPVAYLTLYEPLTFQEVTAHLKGQLAGYKHPRRYYQVKEMPRTASGKIVKRVLLTEERVNYIEQQIKE
jgi:O-succinylbenzoic acid--CoA ligase